MAMDPPSIKPARVVFLSFERALRAGDREAVLAAERKGANYRERLVSGETMLHLAVQTDNPEIVDLFLKNGAFRDVYTEDNTGQSPTTLAYQRNIPAIIALLEKAAVALKTAQRKPEKKVEVRELMAQIDRRATTETDINLIRSRLNQAPELVNAQEPTTGNTLLYHAALPFTEDSIFTYLLNRGANPNIPNKKLQVPLHTTAWHGNTAKTKVLLLAGANPNLKDVTGNTPLHNAAIKGNIKDAALLVYFGANVTSVNKQGNTAQHMAAYHNHPRFVNWLVQKQEYVAA